MFGLSWPETFVILIVAVLFIGPNELPKVISWLRALSKKAKELSAELLDTIHDIESSSGLKDEKDALNKEIDTIIDMYGNEQKSYDISDLDVSNDKKKKS